MEEELTNEIAGTENMSLINSPNCLDSYVNYICRLSFLPCDIQSKIFK